jgi:short subunit dehydrogenase-like uncharacterized protein
MLYGATGYTGVLIAEEAVRREHRPLLAGRSAAKLAPLAARLGLEYVAVDLTDAPALERAVGRVQVVYHAAGPFLYTGEPMRRACVAAGTHYLDITGEMSLLQAARAYDEAARARGVSLIPGVGFDVVPTNCLAQYVAAKVPGAVDLEIGVVGLSHATAGTAKSMVEMLPDESGSVRRDGRMVSYPLGQGIRPLRFPRGTVTAMPIPWGDLETAYWATGIPNITCYVAIPSGAAGLVRAIAPLLPKLLAAGSVRRAAVAVAGRAARGPSAAAREHERSYIWARAADKEGHAAEAWLDTLEAYAFTAVAAVNAVERVLADHPVGVLAPAQAFGADFVMGIGDTRRLDVLP